MNIDQLQRASSGENSTPKVSNKLMIFILTTLIIKYVTTVITRYLTFCCRKGLSNEIVLVTQRHKTRNTLTKIAVSHTYSQTSHPYLFPNIKPGCPLEKKDIPTGRTVMLTTMSLAVINM